MEDAPAGGVRLSARTLVALSLVYAIWGSIYLAVRIVVRTAPPFESMSVRFLMAAVLLASFLVVRGGFARMRLTGRQMLGLVFMGVVLLGVGNGFVAIAQFHGLDSGMTAVILALVPGWIVVFRAVSGDRPSRLTVAGTLLGFGGLLILMLLGRGAPGAVPLGPACVIVFSGLCWAFGSWIRPRVWLPDDPLVGSAYQLFVAGLTLAVAAVIDREPFGLAYGFHAWAAMIYLALVGSIVGFSAYTYLLANAPISVVATHAYVNPVVAVLLGWALLSEVVNLPLILGGGVVLLSVAVVVTGERSARRRAGAPAGAATRDA